MVNPDSIQPYFLKIRLVSGVKLKLIRLNFILKLGLIGLNFMLKLGLIDLNFTLKLELIGLNLSWSDWLCCIIQNSLIIVFFFNFIHLYQNLVSNKTKFQTIIIIIINSFFFSKNEKNILNDHNLIFFFKILKINKYYYIR